ncbi:hypothetical protein DYB32_003237 [Aphanomyces invadans]|nr:hypothetical protein DYB32_003237 [Aphanomyces invadans]
MLDAKSSGDTKDAVPLTGRGSKNVNALNELATDEACTAQPVLKRLKRGDAIPSSTRSEPAQLHHAKTHGNHFHVATVAESNIRERKPRAAAPLPGALINQHKNDDFFVLPHAKAAPSKPAKTSSAALSAACSNDHVSMSALPVEESKDKPSSSAKRPLGATSKDSTDSETSKRVVRRRGQSAASVQDEDVDDDERTAADATAPKTPSAASTRAKTKKKARIPLSNFDKRAKKATSNCAGDVEATMERLDAVVDEVDMNLDYCSVCKVDGDLVCCDVCPRSFHLSCLNKREDELPDNWQCHECLGNVDELYVKKVCQDLSKQRNKSSVMRSLLAGIADHPFAKPFLNPVEDVEYYDDVVKRRMDLTTIATRLRRNEYAVEKDGGNVSPAFVSDVQLVWDNCRLFNDELSGLARAATTLDAAFKSMVAAASLPSRRGH